MQHHYTDNYAEVTTVWLANYDGGPRGSTIIIPG